MKGLAVGLCLSAALVSCGGEETPPDDLRLPFLADTVATGLENPLFITAPPGDTARLFIVEQPGRIRIVQHGTLLTTPFLDFSDSVSHGDEQGMLGLAFAPDYATSGAFYVHTTDPAGNIRILRFHVSADSNVADPASGATILAFFHPFTNHNGGMLAFGDDGYLYVGSGDGGSGGDPNGTGQDPSDLLASILRIDVSGDSAGYTVPPSNPFVGDTTAAPEVWVYGVRNPWRFSFDRFTHDLWIGDVGQGAWEEVDHLPAGVGGQNLGWNAMEGTHCYSPAIGCNRSGKTLPLFDYSHDDGRCSVIGGYVARGPSAVAFGPLAGQYVYGDLCDGTIRVYPDGGPFGPTSTGSTILSFGEDAVGEIYAGLGSGIVIRLIP
jgi:glucose/arabinose dehydrogenase